MHKTGVRAPGKREKFSSFYLIDHHPNGYLSGISLIININNSVIVYTFSLSIEGESGDVVNPTRMIIITFRIAGFTNFPYFSVSEDAAPFVGLFQMFRQPSTVGVVKGKLGEAARGRCLYGLAMR